MLRCLVTDSHGPGCNRDPPSRVEKTVLGTGVCGGWLFDARGKSVPSLAHAENGRGKRRLFSSRLECFLHSSDVHHVQNRQSMSNTIHPLQTILSLQRCAVSMKEASGEPISRTSGG